MRALKSMFLASLWQQCHVWTAVPTLRRLLSLIESGAIPRSSRQAYRCLALRQRLHVSPCYHSYLPTQPHGRMAPYTPPTATRYELSLSPSRSLAAAWRSHTHGSFVMPSMCARAR